MAESSKNPRTCTTARFTSEDPQGSTRIVKLTACSAWLNLDLVDLKPFGLDHKATWERVDSDIDRSNMVAIVQKIGERCASLCSDCDRYRPNPCPPERVIFPSDPEYSPDPALLAAGIPDTDVALVLYLSGS
jgi:hypothetical protein